MSTTLIERLEAIIATGEVSRAGLARAAGLHPNSLRKLGTHEWNPTADTLTRLEKLIQRGTTEALVGTERSINEARNGRAEWGREDFSSRQAMPSRRKALMALRTVPAEQPRLPAIWEGRRPSALASRI